jgi:deoxyribodipyrimidine photo-lyase
VHGVIYLHRRDLRLRDNPVLGAAVSHAREFDAWLLILAIWDPTDDAPVPELRRPRLGHHYRRVWAESVGELAERYGEIGQRLVVLRTHPAEVVSRVCREWAPRDEVVVYTPQVPGTEEAATLREITRRSGAPVVTPDATTLLSPMGLPFPVTAASVPQTFSSFRTRVERAGLPVGSLSGPARGEGALPGALPEPKRPPLPPPPPWIDACAAAWGIPPEGATGDGVSAGTAALVASAADHIAGDGSPLAGRAFPEQLASPLVRIDRGGETAARARLHTFIRESGALDTYKETRNGLLGTLFSSRLAAALAHGTLSPRRVYREVRRYEEEMGANESTYWLIFELLWRDFFHFHAYAWGGPFFRSAGYGRHARPLAPRGLATGRADREVVKRWIAGETGDDLVDAGMRELAATGFTSNRARQNVASYLIYDFKQPWWVGAAWFEHALADYDPASNWGNWAYIAGVGTDSRGGRHFDTRKQAEIYDPDGAFRRFWGRGGN